MVGRPTFLLDSLKESADERPDTIALTFPAETGTDRSYSWMRLYDTVLRIGNHLVGSGVRKGDTVAVMSVHPREQILGFLGAASCGCVPTLLSYPTSKQTEENFLKRFGPIAKAAKARTLLCSGEYYRKAVSWAAHANLGLQILEIPSSQTDMLDGGLAEHINHDPVLMQFSSGTTGLRKGMFVSQKMLRDYVTHFHEKFDISTADRLVNWLPLYHDFGLIGACLFSLYDGIGSAHFSPFEWLKNPSLLFRELSESKATMSLMPNFGFDYCVQRIADESLEGIDLSRLRAILSGGEVVRSDTIRRFLSRFESIGIRPEHVQVAYGQAETICGFSFTEMGRRPNFDRVDRKEFLSSHVAIPVERGGDQALEFVSCGTPMDGTRVRIAGGVEDRIVGEIEVSGDCVFDGYLEYDNSETFTEDNWLRSGDLGYLADGELYVTGRLKDLIISQGANYYPVDIEEVVQTVESIKPGRVSAFGVFDEKIGTEKIVVMAETIEDCTDGAQRARLVAEIRAAVRLSFDVGLHDVKIRKAGTLLKSTSGKMARNANREVYLEMVGSGGGSSPTG